MLEHKYPKRVVNLRYTVNGLHFDAAIDCNWILHAYSGIGPIEMMTMVPIELYCFDHQEWDIRMLYQDLHNAQPTGPGEHYCHTEVELEGIIEETKKWIAEELGNIGKPKKPEDNKEDRNTLF